MGVRTVIQRIILEVTRWVGMFRVTCDAVPFPNMYAPAIPSPAMHDVTMEKLATITCVVALRVCVCVYVYVYVC